jgi:hypothetical protein
MKLGTVIVKCMSVLPILIAIVAFNCPPQKSAPKTAQQEQPTLSSYAGCYELTLGRWWPWGFGSDDVYFTPPHRIRLLTEPGTQGWEKNGLLLRALPDPTATRKGRGGPSFWNWSVRSPKQIDLTWTDGFTGITINLERKGPVLKGWLHTHSDAATFIHHSAHVTARPVDCEKLANSRD